MQGYGVLTTSIPSILSFRACTNNSRSGAVNEESKTKTSPITISDAPESRRLRLRASLAVMNPLFFAGRWLLLLLPFSLPLILSPSPGLSVCPASGFAVFPSSSADEAYPLLPVPALSPAVIWLLSAPFRCYSSTAVRCPCLSLSHWLLAYYRPFVCVFDFLRVEPVFFLLSFWIYGL